MDVYDFTETESDSCEMISSDEISEDEEDLLSDIREAALGDPETCVCDGQVVLKTPIAVRYKQSNPVSLVAADSVDKQKEALQPLLDQLTPAVFGKGKRTVLDRSVRDAWTAKAADIELISGFDPASSGIMAEVQEKLGGGSGAPPLVAELYALNIYIEGGHFLEHKDTPRTSDTFGTLVCCLPTLHCGGVFSVRKFGMEKHYDWGDRVSRLRDSLQWCAFYSDVNHEVGRVRNGCRVTLTYTLRRPIGNGRGVSTMSPPVSALMSDALKRVLASPNFLPDGGTLAFPCFHFYTSGQVKTRSKKGKQVQGRNVLDKASAACLKSNDAEIAGAAVSLGLEVSLVGCLFDDGDGPFCEIAWELNGLLPNKPPPLRRYMDFEKLGKIMDKAVRGSCNWEADDVLWVFDRPTCKKGKQVDWDEEDPNSHSMEPAFALFARVPNWNDEGYFGNEAISTEFYVSCALRVAIPLAEDPSRRARLETNRVGAGSSCS